MAKNEFVDMFVKAIGELTNGLGIQARELAEKLGISKGTLSNYMKDSTFKGRNWSHARVILLVLYFGEERVHDLKSFKKCVCEELSAKEKCEDKKDESEECEETDGIQYSDNDINNFINKAKKIMLERYCELENGSLRKDDEERDNIRRYILQKYPTVVEKYKKDHLKTKSSKAVELENQSNEMETEEEVRCDNPKVLSEAISINRNAQKILEADKEFSAACNVEKEHPEEYIQHLLRAAKLGHRYATYCLGVAYIEGNSVKRNSKKAVEYFFRAGKMGSDDAVYQLKLCYTEGDGVEKSDMKATWLLNILIKINYQPKDVVDISLNPEVKLSKKYGKKFKEFVPETEDDYKIRELILAWKDKIE